MAKTQMNEEVRHRLKAAESAIDQIKSRFGDGAIMKFDWKVGLAIEKASAKNPAGKHHFDKP
jgi:hypothetical protein